MWSLRSVIILISGAWPSSTLITRSKRQRRQNDRRLKWQWHIWWMIAALRRRWVGGIYFWLYMRLIWANCSSVQMAANARLFPKYLHSIATFLQSQSRVRVVQMLLIERRAIRWKTKGYRLKYCVLLLFFLPCFLWPLNAMHFTLCPFSTNL
jgi:hypothetical protein